MRSEYAAPNPYRLFPVCKKRYGPTPTDARFKVSLLVPRKLQHNGVVTFNQKVIILAANAPETR